MSLLHFLLVLTFIFNVAVVLLLRPFNEGGDVLKLPKNVPQVSFKNFKLFNIDENRYVTMTLLGEYGEGYNNGTYRVKDVNLEYQNSLFLEKLRANYAVYKDGEIEVFENVKYQRSDNSSIEAEKLSYDVERGYFYIPDEFIFRRGGTVAEGRTMVIRRDSGVINAFNIKATVIGKR
jgi:LPS export ABC transporter protein LptC